MPGREPMSTARATETRYDSETIMLPLHAAAKRSKWRLLLAPAILAGCLWMYAQNTALEQRVDQDVAAWAASQ